MRQTLLLLAAAVFIAALPCEAKPQAKRKPAPVPAQYDPLTEWELVNGAAMEALGDASLFDSYRTQFREQFHDTHWHLGRMARQGGGVAEYAEGVLALHGYFDPPAVEAACRHFGAALAKGYAGAKFRLSQCLEKDEPARAAALLREAADSGHPAAAELLGRACLEATPPQAACARERLTVAAAGTGVPRDFAEARKWLEKAQQGGIASARELLNWMDKENPEKPSK